MQRKTIGKFISELRKSKNMTQKELGDLLFVSDKTVSRWERDESEPELSLIPVIADVFEITADELLRGKRKGNSPDLDEETERRTAKGDAFRLALYERKKKFRSLSLLSVGIASAGLLAAVICNCGFSKGTLGFCLACAFFIAAAICQTVFTINSRLPEIENENTEEIRKLNAETTFASVKIFFFIFLLFAFCLPIGTLTLSYFDSHYGLRIDSWLFFGTAFALGAYLVGFCAYRLFILDLLLEKKIVYLTQEKRRVLNEKNAVLKKSAIAFAIVFAAAFTGLVALSIADENHVFRKENKFDDPNEFIQFVQNDYDQWLKEASYPNPPAVGEFPSAERGEIDGKSYYYNPDLYYILNVRELENGDFVATVITNQAHYDSNNLVNNLNAALIFLQFLGLAACVGYYLIKTGKSEKTALE